MLFTGVTPTTPRPEHMVPTDCRAQWVLVGWTGPMTTPSFISDVHIRETRVHGRKMT